MDIETRGLGAGSYPEPPEQETKTINLTLRIEYTIRGIDIPKEWEDEEIKEDVKENISYYIDNAVKEKWEVDIIE